MTASSRLVAGVYATLCAWGLSSAVAQEAGAPRRSLLKPPPAIVSLAFAPRAAAERDPAPDPELFAPFEASPITTIQPSYAAPLDERDFAFDALEPPQQALALALDDWRRGGRGAERRRGRNAILEVYAARSFEPLWQVGGAWSEAAQAVTRRLREAADDGLDLRVYKIPATETAARLEDEFSLSEAVAAYVAQASGSRVDPERISRLIAARPPLPDAGAALKRLAAQGFAAGDALRDYNPPHYGYQQLRGKLAELRAHHSLDGVDTLAAAETADDPLDDSLSAAKRAARRKKAAEMSPSRLEAEILANMERWRWLPRDLGAAHVEVNIPEFELAVVRDGSVTHRARVIVGKEGTPTPVFSSGMESVIVNPSWYVPQSIIRNELLPKHGGNLSGLSARGWKVSYAHGKLMVRQPPGEDNALGRVKFIFPNDFAVYMHDTPSRGLFASARRAFSHGCMRVEDPFALAVAVLGPGSGWSEERVRKLVGASERYINLTPPLPVHVEYFTAFVDDYGRLALREDLYGYSARVRRELGFGG
ncbi:MAG TPA: L,D-transpeptidase family protein [Methylocystis sp.]|nr:L,D-transpeptidase family protein [Methylocystis sp.]